MSGYESASVCKCMCQLKLIIQKQDLINFLGKYWSEVLCWGLGRGRCALFSGIFLPPVLNARLPAEVISGSRIKSERGFAAIFYPLELRPHVICLFASTRPMCAPVLHKCVFIDCHSTVVFVHLLLLRPLDNDLHIVREMTLCSHLPKKYVCMLQEQFIFECPIVV